MDFAFDDRTEDLRKQLLAFMDEHVRPAEKVFEEQVAEMEAQGRGWERPAIIDDLKVQARSLGLWNLFLTHRSEGAGLTNLQYAPLAEITGHSPATWSCSPTSATRSSRRSGWRRCWTARSGRPSA
jgi:acyl-CoA dehydrogenase